jgi:serine/threonine-protein kinase
VDRAVYLLDQICESLAEAHDVGLIHRDIKPANIQTCCTGRQADVVKVLDFGLVRPADLEEGEVGLTLDHVVAGTPAYMAPEQVLHPQSVSVRVDIYAVGCVAYWLLTGRTVFEGENVMDVLMQHVNKAPTPPSRVREEPMPRRLDEVIMSCLEKDPDKRPQSADKLKSLFEQSLVGARWTPERARQWWKAHVPEGPET